MHTMDTFKCISPYIISSWLQHIANGHLHSPVLCRAPHDVKDSLICCWQNFIFGFWCVIPALCLSRLVITGSLINTAEKGREAEKVIWFSLSKKWQCAVSFVLSQLVTFEPLPYVKWHRSLLSREAVCSHFISRTVCSGLLSEPRAPSALPAGGVKQSCAYSSTITAASLEGCRLIIIRLSFTEKECYVYEDSLLSRSLGFPVK